MTEAKDNSSLPLLLSITGAILAVAVGGWFLLNQEATSPIEGQATPVIAVATSNTTSDEDPMLENTEAPDEGRTVPMPDEEATGVDTELRKARLAADADILVFPVAQSALHYYDRALDIDPRHAIAIAELDTILARVAQTVTQHLDAEEYHDAYEIAVLVAKQNPEHALVVATERTLDDYTEELVAQAIQHAQQGNDDQAAQVLATAEALPARNPLYFDAIRDSIVEVRDVRLAAERDKAQRSQLANDEARTAWIERIQKAIAQGNLISPAGASARDLLAERNSWTAERRRMTSEVLAAIVDKAGASINDARLDDAEALVNAATELGAEASAISNLRSSLESALVQAESNRIAQLTELVKVKSAQVRYPRRAQERNITGWVDVYFTVTPTGETADVLVNKSEPNTVFDKAAIDAVRKWAFQPVEYRGQVISKRAATRLVFRIE